jgi:hypothetical protein
MLDEALDSALVRLALVRVYHEDLPNARLPADLPSRC